MGFGTIFGNAMQSFGTQMPQLQQQALMNALNERKFAEEQSRGAEDDKLRQKQLELQQKQIEDLALNRKAQQDDRDLNMIHQRAGTMPEGTPVTLDVIALMDKYGPGTKDLYTRPQMQQAQVPYDMGPDIEAGLPSNPAMVQTNNPTGQREWIPQETSVDRTRKEVAKENATVRLQVQQERDKNLAEANKIRLQIAGMNEAGRNSREGRALQQKYDLMQQTAQFAHQRLLQLDYRNQLYSAGLGANPMIDASSIPPAPQMGELPNAGVGTNNPHKPGDVRIVVVDPKTRQTKRETMQPDGSWK